jgi:hypothetical protein
MKTLQLTVDELQYVQDALTLLQQKLGSSSWVASMTTKEDHEQSYAMKQARDEEVYALKQKVIDYKRAAKRGERA